MYSPSPSSRRTTRLAWELDTDDLARAASATDTRRTSPILQPLTAAAACKAPIPSASPISRTTENVSAARADELLENSPQQLRLNAHASSVRPLTHSHEDDASLDSILGGGGDTSGNKGSGNGSLLVSDNTLSSVSILLRAAASDAAGRSSSGGRLRSHIVTSPVSDAISAGLVMDAAVMQPSLPQPGAATSAGTEAFPTGASSTLPYHSGVVGSPVVARLCSTNVVNGDSAAAVVEAVRSTVVAAPHRCSSAPFRSRASCSQAPHHFQALHGSQSYSPLLPSSVSGPFNVSLKDTSPLSAAEGSASATGVLAAAASTDGNHVLSTSAALSNEEQSIGIDPISWGSADTRRLHCDSHVRDAAEIGSSGSLGRGSSGQCSRNSSPTACGELKRSSNEGRGRGGSPVVTCHSAAAAVLPSSTFSSPVIVSCTQPSPTIDSEDLQGAQLRISFLPEGALDTLSSCASVAPGLAPLQVLTEAERGMATASVSRTTSSSFSRRSSATSAALDTAAAIATAATVGLNDTRVAVSVLDGDLHDTDIVANVFLAGYEDDEDEDGYVTEGASDTAEEGNAEMTGGVLPPTDDEAGEWAGILPREVRRRLSAQMGRQQAKSIRTWKHLSHSRARQPPGYWLLGTLLLLLVMVGVFLFMAGQYEFVRPIVIPTTDLATAGGTSMLLPDNLLSRSWGPASLGSWLAVWRSPTSHIFNFDYLRLWGGRYAPDVASGQWWRWVSSLLLHQSSIHLAGNAALMLVLSAYLESLFGFWRILPVWLVAGVAGNMVSAFFESPCMLVVGSSGAVFGLLGAYVADIVLNFESIPLLWLRLLAMVVVASLLVALQVTGHGGTRSGSTSHASHIGGFLAGGVLALLVLPDFKERRCREVWELLRAMGTDSHMPDPATPGGQQLYSYWQRNRVLLYILYGTGVLLLLLLFVAMPLLVYRRTFHRMVCG